MSTKPAKREKRFGPRRKAGERRDEIRWEPDKSARRTGRGRRREDGWDPGKKR